MVIAELIRSTAAVNNLTDMTLHRNARSHPGNHEIGIKSRILPVAILSLTVFHGHLPRPVQCNPCTVSAFHVDIVQPESTHIVGIDSGSAIRRTVIPINSNVAYINILSDVRAWKR